MLPRLKRPLTHLLSIKQQTKSTGDLRVSGSKVSHFNRTRQEPCQQMADKCQLKSWRPGLTLDDLAPLRLTRRHTSHEDQGAQVAMPACELYQARLLTSKSIHCLDLFSMLVYSCLFMFVQAFWLPRALRACNFDNCKQIWIITVVEGQQSTQACMICLEGNLRAQRENSCRKDFCWRCS